jgi:tetratricopeptide (TPR) repeat protein
MRWILSLGLCLMLGLAACGPRETAAPAELLDRGVRLQIQGDNEGALACYHRAATLAGDGDLALQALAHLRMAVLYTNSYVTSGEDIDKYRTALRLYTRLADTTQMVTCLRAMGMQLAQSDADSATHYLSRAVALLSERADTVGQSECLEALARTQYAAGNYRLALQMSQMSIAACHPAPEAAYCDAAMALARLGKPDSAQLMLSKATTVVPSLANQVLRQVARREIALARGDYKQAHLLGQQVNAVNDSVRALHARQRLAAVERRLDHQQEQARLDRAHRHNAILWAVVALLALALAAAVAFYVWLRRKQEQDHMELMERLQIEGGRTAGQVLDNVAGDQQLQDILSRQIENIRSLIDLSYKYSERPGQFMTKFRERIEQGRLPDGFWGNLRYYVDSKYDNIITRLEQQHPSLTTDELYIMGLLCCGFTYADIAVCMGYSNINYVNTKKSRMAKKMGLHEPLSQYLRRATDQDAE